MFFHGINQSLLICAKLKCIAITHTMSTQDKVKNIKCSTHILCTTYVTKLAMVNSYK